MESGPKYLKHRVGLFLFHQMWKTTEELQVVDGMMKPREYPGVSLTPIQSLPPLAWKNWSPTLVQFLSIFPTVNFRTLGIK